jgi:hypothetical protein
MPESNVKHIAGKIGIHPGFAVRNDSFLFTPLTAKHLGEIMPQSRRAVNQNQVWL